MVLIPGHIFLYFPISSTFRLWWTLWVFTGGLISSQHLMLSWHSFRCLFFESSLPPPPRASTSKKWHPQYINWTKKDFKFFPWWVSEHQHLLALCNIWNLSSGHSSWVALLDQTSQSLSLCMCSPACSQRQGFKDPSLGFLLGATAFSPTLLPACFTHLGRSKLSFLFPHLKRLLLSLPALLPYADFWKLLPGREHGWR